MKIKLIITIILVTIIASLITFFHFKSRKFQHYLSESQSKSAFNVEVNPNAPVLAKAKIDIQASNKEVWKVLTQLNNWPEWQTEVSSVEFQGPIQEGTMFNWKVGALKFKSRIHTIVPQMYFGWTGEIVGVQAIYNWTIEESENFVTVYVEESLQGPIANILKSSFQENLKIGMEKNLLELKHATENISIE
ncbi:SRPBCC family protein [Shivajiella indica]|uniref:SRPBCC family protein n=1 Tax=Shivajiella indica TaxID=872115 RepID=A0ABW5B6M3_9BACT